MIISNTTYFKVLNTQILVNKFFTKSNEHDRPLIVIHGGPAMTHDYLLTLQEIAKQQPVIFYDQLAADSSNQAQNINQDVKWDLNYFAQQFSELIKILELTSFDLLGHAWGAALAVVYAATKPNNLHKLILASPWLSAAQWSYDVNEVALELAPEIHQILVDCEKHDKLDDSQYLQAIDKLNKNHFCRIPEPKILQDSMDKINRDVYQTMWGKYETKIVGTLQNVDLFHELSLITVPTLITCGRYDVARPETMMMVAEEIAGSKLEVFEQSSHFPHLEEQQRYLELVLNFLK
jgi:proline iminopeptidase